MEMRSSSTVPSAGLTVASPSSRPTASEERMTALAPLCRTRPWFSASRTAATISAVGLSWRAVNVASTVESSRAVVMMISLATGTPARRSTSEWVASPMTPTSPISLASSTDT